MTRSLPAHPREGGALLLTVMLLMAALAALALGLNRAAGMNAQSVSADYDSRNAMYLAKAGVAAAKYLNQISACSSAGVSGMAFAGGTIGGTIAKPGTKTVTITGSGATAGGATATISLKDFHVVDFGKSETKDLGGGVMDTWVDQTNPQATQKDDTSLQLVSGQANALLFWPMADIPADSEVLSATLILTQTSGSLIGRTVTVHRMTTKWDGAASWSKARAGTAWNGGDYSSPVVASAVVGLGNGVWDVTGLVEGWDSNRLANNGMLLRLPNPGQSASFYSREAGLSMVRPILRVSFAKPC